MKKAGKSNVIMDKFSVSKMLVRPLLVMMVVRMMNCAPLPPTRGGNNIPYGNGMKQLSEVNKATFAGRLL